MYKTVIWQNEVVIEGLENVFSPNGLDGGTEFMLSCFEVQQEDKVLDLGCGTGVVGIAVAKVIGTEKVVMVDSDPEAIRCSKKNLSLNSLSGIKLMESNGFDKVEDKDFTLILSNPPYHTDFAVAKGFIESGKNHLDIGGKMVLVVKRLDWYKNKMTSVFGGVQVYEKNGYYVIISKKRDSWNKTIRKQEKAVKKKHLKKMDSSANRKSKKHK